jgi:hypothetical protein
MQTGFSLLEIVDHGTGGFKLVLSVAFSVLMGWQIWQSIVRPEPPIKVPRD